MRTVRVRELHPHARRARRPRLAPSQQGSERAVEWPLASRTQKDSACSMIRAEGSGGAAVLPCRRYPLNQRPHGSVPRIAPDVPSLAWQAQSQRPFGDILAIAGRDRHPVPSGRYRGRPVLSGSHWSILAHSTLRRASQIVCEPTDNHSNETSDRCPDDQGGSDCCDHAHRHPPQHSRRHDLTTAVMAKNDLLGRPI
jgi:hypothetical protein